VLTLRVKPAADGDGLCLRLLNAGDAPAQARIGTGLLAIESAAACDLLEQPQHDLPVVAGAVTLDLPPRQLATIRLRVQLPPG
jgi:hypothetical protein